MSPEQFWKEYVGAKGPVDFFGEQIPQTTEEVYHAAIKYVDRLPCLYGIVLRGTWKRTWSDYGYQKEEVVGELIRYLEAERSAWENAVPKPRAPILPAAPLPDEGRPNPAPFEPETLFEPKLQGSMHPVDPELPGTAPTIDPEPQGTAPTGVPESELTQE